MCRQMSKRNIRILAALVALVCCATTASVASPTHIKGLTPSPSPSPSQSPFTFCANKATGVPTKIETATCPSTTLALGTGPLAPGSHRPHGLNNLLRNRFEAARLAAKKLHYTLSITSGWRSLAEQQRIYRLAVKKYKNPHEASNWVLPPEQSMHPWGLAVDLHFRSQSAANWFKHNSAVFGLCRMYKNEWWHFEPVIAPGGHCPKLKAHAG